jgi:hypothetical protein
MSLFLYWSIFILKYFKTVLLFYSIQIGASFFFNFLMTIIISHPIIFSILFFNFVINIKVFSANQLMIVVRILIGSSTFRSSIDAVAGSLFSNNKSFPSSIIKLIYKLSTCLWCIAHSIGRHTFCVILCPIYSIGIGYSAISTRNILPV